MKEDALDGGDCGVGFSERELEETKEYTFIVPLIARIYAYLYSSNLSEINKSQEIKKSQIVNGSIRLDSQKKNILKY